MDGTLQNAAELSEIPFSANTLVKRFDVIKSIE